MRWVVELPAPSGGIAATVTVESDSWAGALSSARGGVSIRKFRCEFENEGVVRVNDLEANERYTVRPYRASLVPAADAPSDAAAPAVLRGVTIPPSTGRPSRAPAPAGGTGFSVAPPPGTSVAIPPRSSVPPTSPIAADPTADAPAALSSTLISPAVPAVPPQPAAEPVVPPAGPAQPVAAAPTPTVEAAKPAEPVVEAAKPAEPTPAVEAAKTAEPAPAVEAVKPAEPAVGAAPTPSEEKTASSVDLAQTTVDLPVFVAPAAAAEPPKSETPAVTTPALSTVAGETGDQAQSHSNGADSTTVTSTLLFERDQDPSTTNPLTYRERVLAVAPGTSVPQAEALARQTLTTLKRSLATRPRGRYVTVAVFDHVFSARPTESPLVVLRWKDWRSDVAELQIRPALAPAVAPTPIAPPEAPAVTPAPAVEVPVVAEVAPTVEAPAPVAAIEAPAPPAAEPAPVEAAPVVAEPAPVEAAPAAAAPTVVEDAPVAATAGVEAAPVAPTPAVEAAPVAATPAVEAAPVAATPAVVEAAPVAATPAVVEAAPVVATPAVVEPAPVAPEPAVVEPSPIETPAPVAPAAEAPAVVAEAPVEAAPSPEAPAPVATSPEAEAAAEVETSGEHEAATGEPHDESGGRRKKRRGRRDSQPSLPKVEVAAPVETPVVPADRKRFAGGRRGPDLLSELFDSVMDLSFQHSVGDACALVSNIVTQNLRCDAVLVFSYDINRDEFVVHGEANTGRLEDRVRAKAGSYGVATRSKRGVNLPAAKGDDRADEGCEGGPAMFVPALFHDRLFALLQVARLPGSPAFEADELDAATYLSGQLAETLSHLSLRQTATDLSDHLPGPAKDAGRR